MRSHPAAWTAAALLVTAAPACRRDAPASAPRTGGVPQLAASGAELVVAWRDTTEPSRIRTAVVEVP